MVSQQDIHQQLADIVKDAEYPVTGPFDILPALPNGPETSIESGDFEVTAKQLTTDLPKIDFPYDTPEAFADDVIDTMEAEDYF